MISALESGQFCNSTIINSRLAMSVTHKQIQPLADIFGLSNKRVYYCQRCLNHGILAPRKNHKCECIHAQCNCAKCILVERRRVLNTQLHELEESEQQNQQQRDEKQLYSLYSTQNMKPQYKQFKKSQSPVNQKPSQCNSNLIEPSQQEIAKQPKNLQEIIDANQNGCTNSNKSIYFPDKNNIYSNTEENKLDGLGLESNIEENSEIIYQNNRENSCNVENGECAYENFTNDDIREFRSRISTSNSTKSNETSSSIASNSSYPASSPIYFSDIGDCIINDSGNLSAFRRISFPPSTGIRIKGERVPNCQKCGQHGHKSRLKGHKRFCPFKNCECAKCQVITERQKLMADQIKIRRRQCKDTLMKLKREKFVAASAAVANSNIGCFDATPTTNLTTSIPGENEYMHSQLYPSLLALPNNPNETASLPYINTLNLLCKKFMSTPMSLNPTTSAEIKPEKNLNSLADSSSPFSLLVQNKEKIETTLHVSAFLDKMPKGKISLQPGLMKSINMNKLETNICDATGNKLKPSYLSLNPLIDKKSEEKTQIMDQLSLCNINNQDMKGKTSIEASLSSSISVPESIPPLLNTNRLEDSSILLARQFNKSSLTMDTQNNLLAAIRNIYAEYQNNSTSEKLPLTSLFEQNNVHEIESRLFSKPTNWFL